MQSSAGSDAKLLAADREACLSPLGSCRHPGFMVMCEIFPATIEPADRASGSWPLDAQGYNRLASHVLSFRGLIRHEHSTTRSPAESFSRASRRSGESWSRSVLPAL